LSPDGNRLYEASLSIVPPKSNRIRVIDLARLEQQLTTAVTVPVVMIERSVPANTGQTQSPQAMAVSPDEKQLYLLVDRIAVGGPVVNSVFEIIDTADFTAIPPAVDVGRGATALALSPDGKSAVVTNMHDNTISIIDTVARAAASPLPVGN